MRTLITTIFALSVIISTTAQADYNDDQFAQIQRMNAANMMQQQRAQQMQQDMIQQQQQQYQQQQNQYNQQQLNNSYQQRNNAIQGAGNNIFRALFQ